MQLGFKKEEVEAFRNFLADEADLHKLIRLKEGNQPQLPSVSKMTRSTCLVHYTGPHGGRWHGTGFLATFPNIERVRE